MKGDLRNLMTSQEGYTADYLTYYNGPIPAAAMTYNPSRGVTITIVEATNAGWSATATSTATTWTCAVYIGTAAPLAPRQQRA